MNATDALHAIKTSEDEVKKRNDMLDAITILAEPDAEYDARKHELDDIPLINLDDIGRANAKALFGDVKKYEDDARKGEIGRTDKVKRSIIINGQKYLFVIDYKKKQVSGSTTYFGKNGICSIELMAHECKATVTIDKVIVEEVPRDIYIHTTIKCLDGDQFNPTVGVSQCKTKLDILRDYHEGKMHMGWNKFKAWLAGE